MDTWIDIRRKARECHAQALGRSGGDHTGRALVAAALAADDLELRRFEAGETFDEGVLGALERESRMVNVVKGLESHDEIVVVAHEVAHFRLHLDATNEVTTSKGALGGDSVDSGSARVQGYSSRERKEVQADVFAGEFLCPSDWVREEYIVRGQRPPEIAERLGIPYRVVLHQTIRALLLPALRPAVNAAGAPRPVALDDSQRVAAEWSDGPLLVDAGPGTGKTRTLIHRMSHLLATGTAPGEILALTFSNKAAGEMRERLAAVDQQASIELWAGTFHAFGLELLTKWPQEVGRTENVQVLDETQSLALLERRLHDLPLKHYQNLYEPAYRLAEILKAISRCKDELVTPAQYLAEAEAALNTASDDKARVEAEKAVEVGKVYEVYQEELDASDAVDFGDLVMLTVRLVEESDAVRQYIAGFKHVLVDEYQDVNYASARLLRAVHGVGAEVWVVADQRQSIYRFRGAEPSNVARFEEEFGGRQEALGTNYRSVEPVVEAFARFSGAMGDGRGIRGSWETHRTDGGSVSVTVAPNTAAEAEAIRERIEQFRQEGIPYRDQALLARGHLTLSRLTGVLEQLDVPLLYLGDLFERDEVRDLLSLVSLGAERGGAGLVRVGQLPAYGATREDISAVVAFGQAKGVSVFDAMARLAEVNGLSERGRAGLSKLREELDGLEHVSAWSMLTAWLFERSEYLQSRLTADDTTSKQQLIAIYHLLKVCSEQDRSGDHSRRRFLERIRRIEALNQDGVYRAVASEASDIDAVRVMTIHGSKGLEFRAVHLPALATGYTPSSWKGVRCPPPPTLSKLAMKKEGHAAEEECLFFVGASRARDHLSITRAERYTANRASSGSGFLNAVAGMAQESRYEGSGKSFALPVLYHPQPPREQYTQRDLDVFLRCPARYRYQVVDALIGGGDRGPYLRFHRCVYQVIDWMRLERDHGRAVSAEAALARLIEVWDEQGPTKHAYEPMYRREAETMVTRMAGLVVSEPDQIVDEAWTLRLGDREVALVPDRVVVTPEGVRVQRIRTGRESDSEQKKPVYGLLRRGAELQYPGSNISVETLYPATGNVVPVSAKKAAAQLREYEDAVKSIERGEFGPTPDRQKCPTCPFYFACGA